MLPIQAEMLFNRSKLLVINSMKENVPITRAEVIGKCVRCILQRDREKAYQEREIVVELESGLRFSLESRDKEVLDSATGLGFIYPYLGSKKLYCEISASSNAELRSPIKR